MDRNKPLGGSRSTKAKIGAPHHGSELYALGSKSSTNRDDKSKVMSAVKSVPDRKRESAAPLLGVSKKPKLGTSIGTVPRLSAEGASTSSSVLEPWEQIAIDCDPAELVNSVLSAIDQQDSDTIVGLLCGSAKLLASLRSKSDPVLNLSLLYLAKLRPSLFCNEIVTSALVSILKRDSQHAFKGRNNPTAHVLAANLLARGYHEKKHWPEAFVRMYIDDAANERVWVDSDDCTAFVENICTAFGTRVPPKSMLQPELNALSQSGKESLTGDDDSNDNSMQCDSLRSEQLSDCPVQDRYSNSSHIVEKYVLDTIKEQLNRRQQQDCSTRNFLKFLSSTSGISDVRAMAVSRLELWIHNGKIMKPAQELLTYICYNISMKATKDHEVLANLVKMRLKTKPLINIYMSCLKEMINLEPDTLYVALYNVVQNELSNARNPNNMGMLATMFQAKPEQSAKHLAEIYHKFLLQREDCLRTLRVFLRELVKMLRYDINLVEFCKEFLSRRKDTQRELQILEAIECKDRIFHSIVDLTCLCMFLTVSPQVREANNSLRAGRDMRHNPVLLTFYNQMSEIQLDALTWMHEMAPIMFKPQPTEYSQALHKILLLDAPEQYSKCDQWPPEPERAVLLRLAAETPVREDSILRIILIGITKEIPFSVPDTIEVIEQTIRRASSLKTLDYPAVEANKVEIIDFLFSMAEYHHPENIQLPVGYDPPKLAISALYWKAWNVLLMLSSHNPSTFGAFCWEQYPMLRMLMEMCITNQFHDVKMAEEELQVANLEKNQILEFEAHLAAATSKVVITEQNSLLLSQLMLMDPMGVPRRPPNPVLEQLQQLNTNYKLGHLLCRSRKPDLLLDIIQRHGTSQSMPWLADLVQNNNGDFNHLPVQCLCEFLLSNSASINMENTRDAELLEYLRNLLRDPSCDRQTVCEVLEYFLRRLSSTSKQSRILAINGIKLLLQTFHKPAEEEDPNSDWLLRHLPQITHFVHTRSPIIVQLRSACQIENDPQLVMTYIQFIAAHTLHDPVPDMLDHVMDMSQLIVERSTIFQHIIPIPTSSPALGNEELSDSRLQTLNCLFVMFNNYLIKLREHKPPYEWAEYPDLLMVHFADGVQLPIHLNIIHAFVILLTHSSIALPNSIPILDYWFPQGRQTPQAFTIDTSEPVQLLPDWLKLKMIRSPVDRLVDAAMCDLTPDQIVLFVQNFGTPISSMSKLLALLDHAVIEQFDAVKNAILNKAYLGQLIEIQQARGAKNGHITVQALELHSHSQTAADTPKQSIIVLESVNFDQFQTIMSAEKTTASKGSKEIEEIVDLILKAPNLSKLNGIRFKKLVQQLLGYDNTTGKRHKTMEMQWHTTSKTLMHLKRIAESPHGAYFFQNIFQKAHACTFFRAVFITIPEKPENYNFMLQVLDNVIQTLSRAPNLDNATILQILLNKRKGFVKQIYESRTSHSEQQDFLQVILSSKMTELENRGRRYVNDMISRTKTENIVEGIVSVLNIKAPTKTESSPPFDRTGILIDWLAEVDSELIIVKKHQQINLLYSSKLNEFRFYMLSLLCHQANWATLSETVAFLLSSFQPEYDSTTVLNFIEALIENPKLWQGRDKASSKHEHAEYVLNLTMDQVKVFNEYTLDESLCEMNANGSTEPNSEILNSRANLLLKIVKEDTLDLHCLVKFIQRQTVPDILKLKLLQQLYLMIPPMKFIQEDLSEVYTANAQNLKECRMDKISNYIITTIASLQTQKDHQSMSSDAELLIRKLAASHPALFLRQLSVLASLLQGKAHMDLNVLRSEYHLSRFLQVLRVLELLQPLVFEDAYKHGLQPALDCYFTLFRHHVRAKEVYSIMFRFVQFLQAYINTNPSSALGYIEQYIGLLQELTVKYRNYAPLHQLVQGLSLLKHKTSVSELDEDDVKQEFDLEEQNAHQMRDAKDIEPDEPTTSAMSQLDADSRGAASFAIGGPTSKQHQLGPHFHSLVNIIQHSSAEEVILQPLQEIESMTFKRSGFLDEIFDRLLELIFSHSAQVRSNAYILLIRHLKHNPGNRDTNKSTVNAYIQCLKDPNAYVSNSALDNLVEIVVCLQEFASEILRTAFDLGIQSRLNSCGQIKKCIQTLKLQHAC